ncbi:hypothetical protein IFM89_021749 [Coptis chinensis]|uniref:Prolamin-like domain-containing protein n=1 Tax=Coptis chinensis TaxID=261450 RepID=A0A835H4J3_9MAGN|nr:hypothetical protein IFM89_021749 [Coptis chinensis]
MMLLTFSTAAQLPFPLPGQDIQQCLSAFQSLLAKTIPFYYPFLSTFPHNLLYKSSKSCTFHCNNPDTFTLLIRTLSFPALPSQDIQQCLPSFQSVNECLATIFASSISGRVGQLGAACCKAITKIKTSCWLKLFPLINPSFPHLLMDNCAKFAGVAPSTAPIPKGATTNRSE